MSQESYKLYYFDFYARGEPIRMLFNHAKVAFEDKRVQFSEFPELKASGKLEFG